MRKVLMIAYDFPPIGGSGVQRTLKFAKYLPEFGWQPLILTVSNPNINEMDSSLLQELPSSIQIYRTSDFRAEKLAARKKAQLTKLQNNSEQYKKSSTTFMGKLRQVLTDFVNTWLLIPDSTALWFPPALRLGLKIIKQCDIIYSTSSPFTNHLVASVLHKVSGKPWVADFRDPWTQNAIYQQSSKLRASVDFFLERRFLRGSDLVVVTCEATAKSFQEMHPFLPKEKFVEITNGFDAEDFDPPVDSSTQKFTIVYTGRFYSQKNASSPFFVALNKLRHDYPQLSAEIQVIFAGAFGDRNYALLKHLNLEDIVKPLGYVSHKESIKLLFQAHILLLTVKDAPGGNLIYPGKLFEYLAAQKAILALIPEGATADLIREMKAGIVIPSDDVETISKTVLDLYHQYKRGEMFAKVYDNLEKFERHSLTQSLARQLDTVVGNRG